VAGFAAERKDKSSLERVPPPGTDLAAAIREGEGNGLPVWRVPVRDDAYVVVPRLVSVPIKREGETVLVPVGKVAFERHLMSEVAKTGTCAIGPEEVQLLAGQPPGLSSLVLHAMSAPTAAESLVVGRRARLEPKPTLRRLAAAALHDLWGLTNEEVSEQLGHAGELKKLGTRDVRDGRRLWQAIASIPWWLFPDDVPPTGWWKEPSVAQVWRAWLASETDLSNAEGAA